MSNKRQKYLSRPMIIALFVLLMSVVYVFFNPFTSGFSQNAWALINNYNKPATGAGLTFGEWNNLPKDFLDKQNASGDVMTGALTLSAASPTGGSEAATKQYVDSSFGNPDDFLKKGGDSMLNALSLGDHQVSDLANPTNPGDAANFGMLDNVGLLEVLSGASLSNAYIVCGQTSRSATPWEELSTVTFRTRVDTSAAGFSSTPIFIVSLGGVGNHYRVINTHLLNVSNTGFTYYVSEVNQESEIGKIMQYYRQTNDPNYWQWHINWCGIEIK